MPDPAAVDKRWRNAGALGAASTGLGTSLASLAVGACCVSPVIAPLVVGILGASGAAWAAGWKPYTGVLLLASGALLGWSFWLVYRPREACVIDEAPLASSRWAPRVVKIVMWSGAAIWLAALLVRVLLG